MSKRRSKGKRLGQRQARAEELSQTRARHALQLGMRVLAAFLAAAAIATGSFMVGYARGRAAQAANSSAPAQGAVTQSSGLAHARPAAPDFTVEVTANPQNGK